jgi:hypothetical protein
MTLQVQELLPAHIAYLLQLNGLQTGFAAPPVFHIIEIGMQVRLRALVPTLAVGVDVVLFVHCGNAVRGKSGNN